MATIDIRRTHLLSNDEAKVKAEELARSMEQKLGIRWRWEGSFIKFDAPSGKAKGATGVVTIATQEVRVEIDLPFLLKPLRGMVEGRVKDKLDTLLGPAA
jgi:putative polyhydroxyalkanoate system protein